MQEEFLHYIWYHRLYQQINLKTACGQSLEVIHPGDPNNHAGPDFFNAKIKMNETLWSGNVEVHSSSSEWQDHHHHKDKAYDNVILHVVKNNNALTYRTTGEVVPVLEMSYPECLWQQYLQFKNSNHWMACGEKISRVNSFEISLWIQRILIERLEYKMIDIQRLLALTTQNWDETFYRYLFRSFGFGVNGDPFELLAQSLPLNVLLKYGNNIQLVEALLFGQAGFLDQPFEDDYLVQLSADYKFLKQKHQLKSLESYTWKFLRLRPSNFPTIRLSQLAHLLVKLRGVFGLLINESEIKTVQKYLQVEVSSYWQEHYMFQKKSAKSTKRIGSNSKNLIIINTIIPYLFAYGKIVGDQKYSKRALDWLSILKPEKNAILEKWKEKEIEIKNAGDSQALIYLSNYYCKPKKCLQCRIGHKLLTSKKIE